MKTEKNFSRENLRFKVDREEAIAGGGDDESGKAEPHRRDGEHCTDRHLRVSLTKDTDTHVSKDARKLHSSSACGKVLN